MILSFLRRITDDSPNAEPIQPPRDGNHYKIKPRIDMIPYHAMVNVLLYAVEKDPEQAEHGGRLAPWDSHESLVDMPLVCSAWLDPGEWWWISEIGEAARADPRSLHVGQESRRSTARWRCSAAKRRGSSSAPSTSTPNSPSRSATSSLA